MYVSDWIKIQGGSFFAQATYVLLIQLPHAKLEEIHALSNLLQTQQLKGVYNIIPAFDSLALLFDLQQTNHKQLQSEINAIKWDMSSLQAAMEVKAHEIPVCYELGTDWSEIEKALQLNQQEIIKIHSQAAYKVAMIGFLPGFLYLSGMDSRLQIPRKSKVSRQLEAGSVAIGGEQSGIYSLASPGGWYVLGITPLELFNQKANPPFSFQIGDVVRFKLISEDEFFQLKWKKYAS